MTISKALRKLYTAMCGGTTNKNTAGDLIDAIATDYTGGGGSDLPPAGADGNVLTADDGEWVSAAPSAVNNDYIVVFANGAVTHDGNAVRASEIIAEKTAGKNVILQYSDVDFSCAMCDESAIVFSGGIYNMETSLEEQYTFLGIVGAESDSWMYYKLGMPLAGESNNGKILGVDNGEYALLSPSAVNDYVVTLTVTVDPDTQDATISADKSVAEIYAAIDAGKNVYAELAVNINGVDVTQRFYPTMYASTIVCFGANLVDTSGTPSIDPYVIMGTHAGNVDTWVDVHN